MRDPNRINEFTTELNRIWKTYYPQWRFGQFMFNFLGFVGGIKKIDIFFPEEPEMLAYLKEYCGEVKNENKNS